MRLLLAVVALGVALLALAAYETDAFRRLELSTLDTRFEVRGERAAGELITVNIDERTRVAFPTRRYPFPRRFDARVIGVGLHSGPLVAGNVGSLRHLQYTAIGDTCNAASRIEGLTKDAGFPILASEATYALLSGPPDGLVFVDEAEIRGRVSRIRLYGLGAA